MVNKSQLCSINLAQQQLNYSLTKSKRRSCTLQITQQGLIVKVPLNYSSKQIESLLLQKARWILSKLEIVEQRQVKAKYPINQLWLLGTAVNIKFNTDKIELNLNNQEIIQLLTDYQTPPTNKIYCSHFNIASSYLENWLLTIANIFLIYRCRAWIRHTKLQPTNIKISDAKTRWGSASSKKSINLNWRLIELPIEIIDYVIVHELAHLQQLNHSQEFWQLVQQHQPQYQQLRTKLKQYQLTPTWQDCLQLIV